MIPCCNERSITGAGNSEYGVVIIGIAPGGDEWKKTHTPFTGPAGQMLDALLEACGWHRNKCYLTNWHCQWNDEPSEEELAICRPRVDAELASVAPKLIITLGDISCTQFYGKKSLTKHRGVPLWSSKYNAYIMPTYHPSAVLQGHTHLVHDIIRDLQKIPAILNWKPNNAEGLYTHSVVQSKQEAQSILDGLPIGNIPVAIDIEASTAQQDVWSDPLLCIAISYNGKHAYVIPESYARDLSWPDGVCWSYSYGTYDTQGIKRALGIELPIVHDIVLQSYSLDERTPRERQDGGQTGVKQGIHGLKTQANEFENAAFYEDGITAEFKKPRDQIDYPKLYKYNAGDACYTWRRVQHMLPLQQEDGVADLYNNLLMPAYRRFSEQTYRGIYVDVDRAYDLLSDWNQRAQALEVQLQDMALEEGYPYKINLDSPKQLASFLFDTLELDAPERSTRKEILEELDHPFVDGLLQHRTIVHMISTYLVGAVDDLKIDRRLHANVLVHGTVNGRVAYTNPPLQTLPQPYSVGEYAEVRSIYRATDDRYVLYESDYNQIEMWLAQFNSGDKNMLADLQLGDYHRRTAGRILGKDPSLVTDHEKTFQGKKVNFSIVFGVGDRTLANKHTGIGCTVQQAGEYKRAWHKNYYDYQPWVQQVIRELHTTGTLTTVTGRKRRFRLVLDDKPERQAPNTYIQGPAGDYTLEAMIKLHDLLKPYDSYILMIVHDSLVFELNRDYLHITLPLIAEVMEAPPWPNWPAVMTDGKIGNNLLDMTTIRKGGKWV